MKQEGILSGSKERNRFRNIVWEEYDAIHQKYLEIGTEIYGTVESNHVINFVKPVDTQKVTI